MKVGFLLPANFAVGNPGNGVRAQAMMQANALERVGHEVVRMSPWDIYDLSSFDVIQFFQGGFAHHNIDTIRNQFEGTLVFAPIIDSNEINSRYRLAAKVGHFIDKVYTVPGVFQQQANASDLIICRSKHEQDRIVNGLGISFDKTAIILNGVDLPKSVDFSGILEGLNLPDEFILHVSAYTQERKNVVRLVEAVGPTGYPLVIAGAASQGPIYDMLFKQAKIFPNIRLMGFVDKKTLNALYAACKVFCLPSIHEGTGLVALEAGVHGANIVITQHGGPPDYFQDMAEFVNPFDVGMIQKAVIKSWRSLRTDKLKQHISSTLTWDHSASSLAQAYVRYKKI